MKQRRKKPEETYQPYQYCDKMLDIASINMEISAVIQYIDGIVDNEVTKRFCILLKQFHS